MKPLSTAADNCGKMMSRRIQAHDRTTVTLTYSTLDANSLRMMVQKIRLKGDKTPSLSLLARRSLHLYMSDLERAKHSRPDLFAQEIAELERMVTPIPSPAVKSKKVAQ